tara:strand:+ start:1308 stop:1532 length:225 start_codon:yes stop_codon:yes gene_type:complete
MPNLAHKQAAYNGLIVGDLVYYYDSEIGCIAYYNPGIVTELVDNLNANIVWVYWSKDQIFLSAYSRYLHCPRLE